MEIIPLAIVKNDSSIRDLSMREFSRDFRLVLSEESTQLIPSAWLSYCAAARYRVSPLVTPFLSLSLSHATCSSFAHLHIIPGPPPTPTAGVALVAAVPCLSVAPRARFVAGWPLLFLGEVASFVPGSSRSHPSSVCANGRPFETSSTFEKLNRITKTYIYTHTHTRVLICRYHFLKFTSESTRLCEYTASNTVRYNSESPKSI